MKIKYSAVYCVVLIGISCARVMAGEDVKRGAIANQGGSAASMTISQSGVFLLTQNYVGNILISANNVVLDLQGTTVFGRTIGVRVTGSNVTVKNGSIRGATVGVRLEGSNNHVMSLDLVSNGTGVEVTGNANLIQDCRALSSTAAGFSIVGGQRNSFLNCQALNTASSGNTYGFVASNGRSNSFDQCVSEGTSTSGISPFIAAGFALLGSEQQDKIVECHTNNTTGLQSYGVYIPATAVNNIITQVSAQGNGTGYYDEAGASSATSTNQWVANFSYNNGTNFSIGSQFPVSSPGSSRIGVTDNIDGALPALISCLHTGINSSMSLSSNMSYCLASSLPIDIVIEGVQNVTLDLNGNQARSVSVIGSTNIRVKNGSLNGAEANTLLINASSNVNVSHVTCLNATTNGIYVTEKSNNIMIDTVYVDTAGSAGMLLDVSSTNISVVNGTFVNNRVGVSIDTQSAYFYECAAVNNGRDGWQLSANVLFSTFNYCEASNNGDAGFRAEGAQYCDFFECSAIANRSDGFNISGSAQGNLLRACQAWRNVSVGFNIDGGVVASNLLGNCVSDSSSQFSAGIQFGAFSASSGTLGYWGNSYPSGGGA